MAPPAHETTTPLFSRTSLSLRPLQRTTTLMFVSSLPLASKSRSLRFRESGDLVRVALVATDATDSAGEARPEGVPAWARRLWRWREAGGRMEVILLAGRPGLEGPAMMAWKAVGEDKLLLLASWPRVWVSWRGACESGRRWRRARFVVCKHRSAALTHVPLLSISRLCQFRRVQPTHDIIAFSSTPFPCPFNRCHASRQRCCDLCIRLP